jgi:general secretion pathway protein G
MLHGSLRRGFTFLEIMLVVLIIGILVSIVVPKFVGRTESARRSATALAIQQTEVSLQEFEYIYGRYPDSLEELVTPPEPPAGGEAQEFLDRVPVDPWNHDLVYNVPGENVGRRYDLYSMGPNGVDDRGQGDDIIPANARRDDSRSTSSRPGL